nr:baseplate J/gp47 family protein [Synergistaceae bacterium]
ARVKDGEANVIRIYVLTYGQDENSVAMPTQALKDKLLEYLNKYKMLTDWLEIENGFWSKINFSGEVIISEGFNSQDILEKIKSALNNLLNIDTREMGKALRISDVYAAIDNIEGVEHVELDSPKETIKASISELLVMGNINFRMSVKDNG